jgi:hypothetical protein
MINKLIQSRSVHIRLAQSSAVLAALWLCAAQSYATPDQGGNCANCHTNVAGSVSISGNLSAPTTLAVPSRLDGGSTSALPCFTVTAGVSTTIHITLSLISMGVDGVTTADKYAFSIGGTLKSNSQESLVSASTVLGIKTSKADKLVFSLDTTHGWTTPASGTKYFYTSPIKWTSPSVSQTYDLTIGATTPADVYTMTARAGWNFNSQFFNSQEFLINVVAVPEPTSLALFAGCSLIFALRRNRR